MYFCQLNFQTTARVIPVSKMTKGMFSIPNRSTPSASKGASPAAMPGTPIKLPGRINALIQPMKQANTTVARPTLIG